MSRELPDKMFFKIGEAAEIVGVEPHVLRYWESEFRMRPQRSTSGQRMYRRKDLEKFLKIQALVHDQGFTIAGARKALSESRAPGEAAETDRIEDALVRLAQARQRISDLRARWLEPSLLDLPRKR